MTNPNWDGSGPCHSGQVRVFPAGGGSNFILCRHCFGRELAFRRDRNKELSVDCWFAMPSWESLLVYGEPEQAAIPPHQYVEKTIREMGSWK